MVTFRITRSVRIFAATVTAILAVSSCEKYEGEYAAKKKIAAVHVEKSGWYTSYNDATGNLERIEYRDTKYKSEDWTWEKRNLLSITRMHQDGSTDGRETFTYSGGKLTVRENRTAGVKTTFTYEDDKIRAIECYIDGQMYSTSEITHTGDKISRIKTDVFSMGRAKDQAGNDMKLALAPYFNYTARKGNPPQDPIYTETLVVKWSADNIASVESYNGDRINCIWHYTYDSKENPLFNFWTKEELAATTLPTFGSRNNIVSSTMLMNGETRERYDFEYQYDGKYPIVKIRHDSNTPDSQYPREETVMTEYTYK